MTFKQVLDIDYLLNYTVWTEIIYALLIFIFFTFLRKIGTKLILGLILRVTKRANIELNQDTVNAFERPLRALFIVSGIYFALSSLTFLSSYLIILSKLYRSSFIFLCAWGVFNLTSETSRWLRKIGEKLDLQVDKIVLPFIAKLVRFIVVFLAAAIILDVWEYDINGFIAGLGLGGLAFALAAQDTLKNVFGGLVIITEKPFSIGDWIYTPSVEGTVEDITFRSTKIRTFAQALVTVPNSTLANEAITNWTRMGKRRITFYLKVHQNTPPDKLENCVHKIREMLRHHPEIDQQTLFVHFDQFGESSLDIYLYFFTKTTIWGEWLAIKEECNMKILAILAEEGVRLAFPRSEMVIENKQE